MRRWIPSLLLFAIPSACTDPVRTELFGSVAVSFSTQNPTGGTPVSPWAGPAAALDDTLVVGTDTLIITSVGLVLREIELETLGVVDCQSEPAEDECEDVELGPVLVELPLTPGAEQRFSVAVPPQTYVEVEFEIHKVSGGDPADSAFLLAHPEYTDQSIRVLGLFNGQGFVFQSDLNVSQELTLVPPLTLAEMASANLTIRVDIDTWFRDLTGALVDPNSANKGQPNENLLRDNIIASFEAFEDDDRDGNED